MDATSHQRSPIEADPRTRASALRPSNSRLGDGDNVVSGTPVVGPQESHSGLSMQA